MNKLALTSGGIHKCKGYFFSIGNHFEMALKYVKKTYHKWKRQSVFFESFCERYSKFYSARTHKTRMVRVRSVQQYAAPGINTETSHTDT